MWKILEKDSLIYYSRLDKITIKELGLDETIISRPREEKEIKEFKKIENATQIIIDLQQERTGLEILQGLVVRRNCTVQVGKFKAKVLNVYVGATDYKRDVLITPQTIVLNNTPDLDINEIQTSMGQLKLTESPKNLKQIMELVMYPIMYPKLMEKLNLDLSRGVLIHGPPGVGKTRMVLDLVNATNAKLVKF